MGCRKGRMYNKERFIEYLLNREDFQQSDFDLSHLKNMKSVKTLKMTRNSPELSIYPFKCPLTDKTMNGSVPFVFLWKCGCVFVRKLLSFSSEHAQCPLVCNSQQIKLGSQAY